MADGRQSPPREAADKRDVATVGFTFDGRAMEASPSQSIAGALLANGVRSLRSTRGAGRPRGLFCGIGNCFDCLVDVGDECAVRACLRPVAEGDHLRTSASVGVAADDGVANAGAEAPGDAAEGAELPVGEVAGGESGRVGSDVEVEGAELVVGEVGGGETGRVGSDVEVEGAELPVGEVGGGESGRVGSDVEVEGAELVVLGGGPAGMAAALQAADLGCQVTLVDAGRQLGGQIYRQPNRPSARETRAPSADGTDGLPGRFRRIGEHSRIRRLPAATVWAAEHGPDGGFALHAGTPDGDRVLRARAVVVATGAAELALPFPGWDLPGVMTAGAAQAVVKGDGVLPGRRVVVAGSGPFLFPVAATLADAGATVVAVIEAHRAADHRRLPLVLAQHPAKLREAAGYLAVLARHRVPIRTGRAVVAALGDDRVARVQIARLHRDWRPQAQGREELAVDAVCVSYGFVPALDIVRALGCGDEPHPGHPYATGVVDGDQASTVPGAFLAGEATGIGGAEVAELEGVIAGRSAAAYLGHAGPTESDAASYPGYAGSRAFDVAVSVRRRLRQLAVRQQRGPLPERKSHRAQRSQSRGAGPPPSVRRRLRRARRFADQLEAIYRLPAGSLTWLTPDTIVCRCEEATWDDVRTAVDQGAADLRAVKGVTRCGMGYCQGRVCGPPLQLAVAALSGHPLDRVGDFHTRHIATPVRLSTLASTPQP